MAFEEKRPSGRVPSVGLADSKGRSFKTFFQECGKLTRDEFLARFRAPFLVAPVTIDPATWPDAVVLTLEKRTKEGGNDTIIVGREITNDVAITDGSVSKKHAAFTNDEGRWYLTDLKSSNGTSLEDQVLEPETRFRIQKDLSIIELGDVRLNFMQPASVFGLLDEVRRSIRDAATAERPTPAPGTVKAPAPKAPAPKAPAPPAGGARPASGPSWQTASSDDPARAPTSPSVKGLRPPGDAPPR